MLSFCTIGSFGESLFSNLEGPVKCVSLKTYLCQARPALVNTTLSKPFFYPFTVSVNKCRGNCNTIDDLYPRVFVQNKVKNINVKVLILMKWVNETRSLVQHESCKCKYELNESICN